MSDDELHRLSRGGHDPQKVYNAYKRAVEHHGGPTVILAHTVKGYGLGSAEARNATHQEKKLADQALTAFRSRFEIPIPEKQPQRRLACIARRTTVPRSPTCGSAAKSWAGTCPSREVPPSTFEAPPLDQFAESLAGSKGRAVSTTMGFVSMLRQLLKDPKIGKLIVPIIPDEGRTFGMESIIRQVGHLRQPGTALQAARSGHAAVLPRREERADSGRGHHRSRIDGVVHRGGHGILRTTKCRWFPSSPTTRCSDSSASAT